jgi:hypothetical protein
VITDEVQKRFFGHRCSAMQYCVAVPAGVQLFDPQDVLCVGPERLAVRVGSAWRNDQNQLFDAGRAGFGCDNLQDRFRDAVAVDESLQREGRLTR